MIVSSTKSQSLEVMCGFAYYHNQKVKLSKNGVQHSKSTMRSETPRDYYSIKQPLEKANNGVLQVVKYRINPIVMLTDGVHM